MTQGVSFCEQAAVERRTAINAQIENRSRHVSSSSISNNPNLKLYFLPWLCPPPPPVFALTIFWGGRPQPMSETPGCVGTTTRRANGTHPPSGG